MLYSYTVSILDFFLGIISSFFSLPKVDLRAKIQPKKPRLARNDWFGCR